MFLANTKLIAKWNRPRPDRQIESSLMCVYLPNKHRSDLLMDINVDYDYYIKLLHTGLELPSLSSVDITSMFAPMYLVCSCCQKLVVSHKGFPDMQR